VTLRHNDIMRILEDMVRVTAELPESTDTRIDDLLDPIEDD